MPEPSRRFNPLASLNGVYDRVLGMLCRQPKRLLAWILAIYGALWLAATLSFPGMPFDSYEMFAFGREMQWGYWKHPPLEPWLTEIAYRLSGHWVHSHFVLAIASIVVTFWFVWRLGAEMVGESGAVLAVALSVLIYYFGPPVTMYSHNVGQLPVWAATVFIYRKAVLGNRLRDWVGFGVASAILLYSKYSGALLLVVLAGHLLVTREGRQRAVTPGPYLAATTGLLIMLPNLIWLMQSDFLPFTFAFDRPPVDGLGARAIAALKFVAAQIGYHAAIIVVAALAIVRGLPFQGEPVAIDLQPASRFDRSLIFSTAFGPSLIIAALTFWAGVDQRPEIGGSLMALSGLAVVLLLPRRTMLRAPRLVTAIWLCVLVGLPIGHVVFVYAKPEYGSPVPSQLWPARQLSAQMQAIWNSRTPKPLDIVTGSFLQAEYVALYASPRPSVFIDANFRKSPWITPERLHQSGTLVIWATADFPRTDELPSPYREALTGLAATFGSLVLPIGYGQTETYGWAVLLPSDSAQ